ncbi:MAG: T9SS type A sorting domain-containing protein [Chitinophagales bacterium]
MKKILFILLILSTSYAFAQSNLRTRAEDEAAPDLENLSGFQPGDGGNSENYEITAAGVAVNEGIEEYESEDPTVTGTSKNIVINEERGLKDILADIYPNPANDFIVVTLAENRVVTVSLLNLVGQIVLKSTIEAKENYIDISSLKGGIYFVSFMSGDEKVTQKIKVVD